jgi:hypothetical protein
MPGERHIITRNEQLEHVISARAMKPLTRTRVGGEILFAREPRAILSMTASLSAASCH